MVRSLTMKRTSSFGTFVRSKLDWSPRTVHQMIDVISEGDDTVLSGDSSAESSEEEVLIANLRSNPVVENVADGGDGGGGGGGGGNGPPSGSFAPVDTVRAVSPMSGVADTTTSSTTAGGDGGMDRSKMLLSEKRRTASEASLQLGAASAKRPSSLSPRDGKRQQKAESRMRAQSELQDFFADSKRVFHAGYLRKEGGGWTTWKRRYFVLGKDALYYYADEQRSLGSKAAEWRGRIPIHKGYIVEEDTTRKKKHCFRLAHVKLRTYYMQCDTAADTAAWIARIAEVIDKHKRMVDTDSTKKLAGIGMNLDDGEKTALRASGGRLKPIVLNAADDLPKKVQKQLASIGIEMADLDDPVKFEVVLQTLHFIMRVPFRSERMHAMYRDMRAERKEREDNPDYPWPVDTLYEPVDAASINKLYRDVALLSKGGFGHIYTAAKPKKKRQQIILKKIGNTSQREQQSNRLEVGFLRAADHPGIVRFERAIEIGGDVWIEMEYLEGGSLAMAHNEGFDFEEGHVAYIAKQMLSALSYMHKRKWAHRDLKSGNVMMSVDGSVKLIDFGLCANLERGPVVKMVGSPFWMPPEMVRGNYHDTKVDIWSFGITMYEMLAGKPPNAKSRMKALYTAGTTGIAPPPRCSPACDDFLRRCFELDPAQRPTADELLTHAFVSTAKSKRDMAGIITSIFCNNALESAGFF